MGFAKISLDNIKFKNFGSFAVGEFFRLYDSIYVKCSYDGAVCVTHNSCKDICKFSLDEKCEDIVVELKVF